MLHLEMMRGKKQVGNNKQRNFASTSNNVRPFVPKTAVLNYVKDGK